MTDLFQEPNDATPLAPEEREGLLQSWITYRADLNEAEQENIVKGANWARRSRRRTVIGILNDEFVRELHKKMFGDVWNWAGSYRQTERNIGIEAYRIPNELGALLGDVKYWVDQETYRPDEIAVRFHHRIVKIHPFPNGNGRHARLLADMLIELLGGEPFTWGGGSLADVGELRKNYIAALQAADGFNIGPLLEFARS
ncbi:MAG: mobile mystery protein B [Hyphomicrobiales bacterium]|nr:mobile mystery protein B [Hyphomicrobiales bacterium]MCP4998779.1 mobile mystery protein B [Hyphomicrobiales bacterium]